VIWTGRAKGLRLTSMCMLLVYKPLLTPSQNKNKMFRGSTRLFNS
jgi:hypothetical protein